MDLGIAGRGAIVCASSRGLGLACARALAAEGVQLVINGRDSSRLAEAAMEIRDQCAVEVVEVAADVTTDRGRAALLEAMPCPDILVNNSGGPPPAEFTSLDHEDWQRALTGNMVSPLLLAAAVLPGMRDRQFGRIVNVTSAMVTSPDADMGLSSGARAGLTAVLKGVARDVAQDNVTINNLLPERFDTDRQRYMAEKEMENFGISWEEARARQVTSIAARRLGRPEEFGAMCAFLCSAHCGYVSGMNIHLDGGSYPGLI